MDRDVLTVETKKSTCCIYIKDFDISKMTCWADFIIGQIELYDSMSNDWSGNVYITTVLQRQKDFT